MESSAPGHAEDKAPYSVGLWSRSLGNHRAIVIVTEVADATRAHIPWRRHDPAPEAKDIMILDPVNRERVKNAVRVNVNREFGDLVFQPAAGIGVYEVYFMPYKHSGPNHQFVTTYAPVEDPGADPAWLDRNKLRAEDLPAGAWQSLPEAKVVWIHARSEFDRMDPMEVIATAEETTALLAKYPGQTHLLFPEDRRYPIRMADDLPLRWIQNGPGSEFAGQAARGEFYVFQIGVYAARQGIEGLRIDFGAVEGLVGPQAFRCFNLGGVDWLGYPFEKQFAAPQGKVGALWCGVQIPKEAAPGKYEGKITVRPDGAPPTDLKLALEITPGVLEDAGDSELWRQSRLRWLDSTIGIDDDVIAPYTPLTVSGQTVACLNREVRFCFGETGLPESIRSGGREVLDKPISFQVETSEGIITWRGRAPKVTKRAPGVVAWESSSAGGVWDLDCSAAMEFDGYINFRIAVKPSAAVSVKDMRLEIPLRRDVAAYMMGMGRKGGYRPSAWEWKWDVNRANNVLWLGDAGAGLQCKLKDVKDTWNLYSLADTGIPAAWGNDGKGGCAIANNGPDQVLVRAYTGDRTLAAGEELTFRFGLLITPVKPLDPRHWNWRYQHQYLSIPEIGKTGANIINIHHGNELNPHINYPFNSVKILSRYVREAHKNNVKVKIYYTVRELSNHAAELWALRSLGTEIFRDGPGGGCSWLREHLVDHYAAAWHEPNLPNDDIDGAIATTGLSRWHNYYLEGLAWLLKNVEIDGLYLDGIGYDRVVMQRLRKVMERTRPGSLIDFHSGNNFDPAYGLNSPANQYMEHFPYIDSLWFGEGYNYNESPDYWLVEISGIPFGLFGEMLEGGGNPWRGMIYGMTNRLGWGGDPRPIWRLWDEFGIQEAKMIGYWDAACPVKTDNKDVLATVYCKPGKALVSLASWAGEPARCRMAIDWAALGLDPAKVRICAPRIEGFQEEKTFAVSDPIPVDPARGWLIIME
jgi:hypothetical protein